MLTVDELREEVERGAIDTVVAALPDMQGRLMGKRFHARFFSAINRMGSLIICSSRSASPGTLTRMFENSRFGVAVSSRTKRGLNSESVSRASLP